MIFGAPVTFAEAVQSRAARHVLPTSMTSAQLARVGVQLRERSHFSAQTTNADYLQYGAGLFDEMLAGHTDAATVRAKLGAYLDSIDYAPEDPDEEGTLTDLRSDARLNLRINMENQAAQGYGSWKQGQDPAILDQWPAQELYRAESRAVPRDWIARWQDAGGTLSAGGRMIALKNDPIWEAISRFGTPYPPFDYNSGMDVRDVDRAEAMALGLIDRDTQIAPQDRNFAKDAGARSDQFDAALLEELQREGCYLDDEGVLHPSASNTRPYLGGRN